ncbi:MAG TPA: hypothetical protein VJ696_09945 [Rhodanobacteraceae bacterium]|nr:hypothetical protein [Rhodanobacteraceae bacterium]
MISVVTLALLMGIAALFGANAVSWNDKPTTGFGALIISPFIGFFVAAFFSAFAGSAIAFGLWLYSMFRPISIEYIACSHEPPVGSHLG